MPLIPSAHRHRGFKGSSFILYPVLNVKTFDVAEVFDVVGVTAIASEDGYADARVKKIALHSSTSILFAVLALRMSLTMSSAVRSSFHAPTKRSAQPASAFVDLVGFKVLMKVSILIIADSLSSRGLISRNNSVRNCKAVIIFFLLFPSAKIVQIEQKTKKLLEFFYPCIIAAPF